MSAAIKNKGKPERKQKKKAKKEMENRKDREEEKANRHKIIPLKRKS